MAWTTFAALTNPTLPELDANLSILTYLAPVTCTILGTNTLTLTAINAGTPITGYQQNMQLTGIAAATNTTTVVAALGALPSLPVYKDTLSGPVALVGGEIVQNCPVVLFYDQALNANAGGFHLGVSNGSILIGQTVSLTSLNAVGASLTGVLRAASINSGSASVTSFNATSGTFSGSVTAGAGSITGLLSAASVTAGAGSITGLLSAASVSFAGGDAVVRLTSALASITYTAAIVPGAQVGNTVAFAGAAVNDCIVLGLPAAPTASIVYAAYVSAAGSVVLTAANRTPATTITPNATLTFRITDIGFVT